MHNNDCFLRQGYFNATSVRPIFSTQCSSSHLKLLAILSNENSSLEFHTVFKTLDRYAIGKVQTKKAPFSRQKN